MPLRIVISGWIDQVADSRTRQVNNTGTIFVLAMRARGRRWKRHKHPTDSKLSATPAVLNGFSNWRISPDAMLCITIGNETNAFCWISKANTMMAHSHQDGLVRSRDFHGSFIVSRSASARRFVGQVPGCLALG